MKLELNRQVENFITVLEEKVAESPETIAIKYTKSEDFHTETYQELNVQANQLAHYLKQQLFAHHGLTPQQSNKQNRIRIGILKERSKEMLVSMLAVWKLGLSFILLEPEKLDINVEDNVIIERINDSAITCLLTTKHYFNDKLVKQLESEQRSTQEQTSTLYQTLFKPLDNDNTRFSALLLDDERTQQQIQQQSTSNLSADIRPVDQEAYVIYTSGTTGKPKGCLINQTGLLDFFTSLAVLLHIDTASTVLWDINLDFDPVIGLPGFTLIRGGSLYIASKEEEKKNLTVLERCGAHHVNVIMTVPNQIRADSIVRNMHDNLKAVPNLRLGLTGEEFDWDLFNKFETLIYKQSGLNGTPTEEHAGIFNFYGPTEGPIGLTGTKISIDDEEISLGNPLGGREILLANSVTGVPVAAGEEGELCYKGNGFDGYLNRAKATKDRKIVIPGRENELWWRTGDFAQFVVNAHGEYETNQSGHAILKFKGRRDNQIKIFGVRIQLEGIESGLKEYCDPVSRKKVLQGARTVAIRGERHIKIVSFCVLPTETIAKDLKSKLRIYLRHHVTRIINHRIIFLTPSHPLLHDNQLVITGKNYKFDTKKLIQYYNKHYKLPVPTDYTPRTFPAVVKNIVIKAWEDLFGVSGLDETANFDNLGGDSLDKLSLRLMLDSYRDVFTIDFEAQETQAAFLKQPTIATLSDLIIQYNRREKLIKLMHKADTDVSLITIGKGLYQSPGVAASVKEVNVQAYHIDTDVAVSEEEMLADVVGAIRIKVLHGPYYLIVNEANEALLQALVKRLTSFRHCGFQGVISTIARPSTQQAPTVYADFDALLTLFKREWKASTFETLVKKLRFIKSKSVQKTKVRKQSHWHAATKEKINQFLSKASSHTRKLLYVHGDVGLGKTTLLKELAENNFAIKKNTIVLPLYIDLYTHQEQPDELLEHVLAKQYKFSGDAIRYIKNDAGKTISLLLLLDGLEAWPTFSMQHSIKALVPALAAWDPIAVIASYTPKLLAAPVFESSLKALAYQTLSLPLETLSKEDIQESLAQANIDILPKTHQPIASMLHYPLFLSAYLNITSKHNASTLTLKQLTTALLSDWFSHTLNNVKHHSLETTAEIHASFYWYAAQLAHQLLHSKKPISFIYPSPGLEIIKSKPAHNTALIDDKSIDIYDMETRYALMAAPVRLQHEKQTHQLTFLSPLLQRHLAKHYKQLLQQQIQGATENLPSTSETRTKETPTKTWMVDLTLHFEAVSRKYNRGSSRQRLFLLPPITGGQSYEELVKYVRKSQPLVAFAHPKLTVVNRDYLTLKDLAHFYVQLILFETKPDEPIALAGWSFGGFIVLEVAKQLHESGRSINYLGLIDTPAPTVWHKLDMQAHVDVLRARFHWLIEHPLSQRVDKTSIAKRLQLDISALKEQIENHLQASYKTVSRDSVPAMSSITALADVLFNHLKTIIKDAHQRVQSDCNALENEAIIKFLNILTICQQNIKTSYTYVIDVDAHLLSKVHLYQADSPDPYYDVIKAPRLGWPETITTHTIHNTTHFSIMGYGVGGTSFEGHGTQSGLSTLAKTLTADFIQAPVLDLTLPQVIERLHYYNQQKLEALEDPKNYIALKKGFNEDNPSTEVLETTLHDFITKGRSKILLLMGHSGAGKSVTIKKLYRALVLAYETQQKDPVIPLFFNAAQFPQLDNCIDHLFLSQGVSPSQLAFLKKHQKVVFLFDDYDHKIDQGFDFSRLFSSWRQGKFIVTSRVQTIRLKKDVYRLFCERKKARCLKEVMVAPFTQEQVQTYLNNEENGSLTFNTIMQSPSLRALATNPLTLSMLAEVLPEHMQHPEFVVTKPWYRAEVYAAFMNLLLKRTQTIFAEGLTVLDAKTTLPALMRPIGKALAWELFPKTTMEISRTATRHWRSPVESPAIDTSSNTAAPLYQRLQQLFSQQRYDTQLLTHGLPLRLDEGGISFFHRSYQEYFMALAIVDALSNSTALSTYLKKHLLAQHTEVLQFAAEHLLLEPNQEQFEAHKVKLFNLLMRTKTKNHFINERNAKKASNIVTLLNHAKVSFSNQDLSHLQLPYADLSGAVLYRTNLSYTNLIGTRLNRAYLDEAILRYAHLRGVSIDEIEIIDTGNERLYQIKLSGNKQFLLTIGCCDNPLQLWDILKTPLQLKKTITEGFYKNFVADVNTKGKDIVATPGYEKPSYRWWGNLFTTRIFSKIWYAATLNLDKLVDQTSFYIRTDDAFELIDNEGFINLISFSHHRNTFFTVNKDSVVKKWRNRKNLSSETLIKLATPISAIAIHSNDTFLALSNEDKELYFIDTKSHEVTKKLFVKDHSIRLLKFDNSGHHLAAIVGAHNLYVWDIEDKYNISTPQILTLLDNSNSILDIDFNEASDFIYASCKDNTLRIWKLQSGEQLGVMMRFPSTLKSVAINHEKLFAGAEDGRIYISNLEKVSSLNQLLSNEVKLNNAFFFNNGKQVIAQTNNNQIQFYETRTGQLLQTVQFNRTISQIYAKATSQTIFLRNENILEAWQFTDKQLLHISSLKLASQNAFNLALQNMFNIEHAEDCAIISYGTRQIALWDYHNFLLNYFYPNTLIDYIKSIGYSLWVRFFALKNTYNTYVLFGFPYLFHKIVCCFLGRGFSYSLSPRRQLFNQSNQRSSYWANRSILRYLINFENQPSSHYISKLLGVLLLLDVFGLFDSYKSAREDMWNTVNHDILAHVLNDDIWELMRWQVSFSSLFSYFWFFITPMKQVIYATFGTMAIVFGAPLKGATYSRVSKIVIHKDNQHWLITDSDVDHTIRIYDLITYTLLHKLHTGSFFSHRPTNFAINSDMTRLGSSCKGNLIRVWDLTQLDKKTTPEIVLYGDQNDISQLCFSPDKGWLASGSKNNKILLWDVDTRQLLYNLTLPSSVNQIDCNENGKLLSVSSDGILRIWHFNRRENGMQARLQWTSNGISSEEGADFYQATGLTSTQRRILEGKGARFSDPRPQKLSEEQKDQVAKVKQFGKTSIEEDIISFLPNPFTLESFDETYSSLQQVATKLPALIEANQIGTTLETLTLPVSLLNASDQTTKERVYTLLAALTQAYIMEHGRSAKNSLRAIALPEQLAHYFSALSTSIKRLPTQTYETYILQNWRLIDPVAPMEYTNIEPLVTYTGSNDEKWFIKVHVMSEHIAAKALTAVQKIQTLLLERKNNHVISSGLTNRGLIQSYVLENKVHLEEQILTEFNIIHQTLRALINNIKRMPEECSPHYFYSTLRPFLGSWPHGVIFTGVNNDENHTIHFKGTSAAQSSIIPAFDSFLNIATHTKRSVQAMREYMPLEHVTTIKNFGKMNIKQFIIETNNDELISAYNQLIDLLVSFRETHYQTLVEPYILNFTTKEQRITGRVPGTGNTELQTFLQSNIALTKEAKIKTQECMFDNNKFESNIIEENYYQTADMLDEITSEENILYASRYQTTDTIMEQLHVKEENHKEVYYLEHEPTTINEESESLTSTSSASTLSGFYSWVTGISSWFSNGNSEAKPKEHKPALTSIVTTNKHAYNGNQHNSSSVNNEFQQIFYGEENIPVLMQSNEHYRMMVFPKHSSAVGVTPYTAENRGSPISGDHYDTNTCKPVEFHGQPSVRCAGKRTTLLYTPWQKTRFFDRVDSNIMLGATLAYGNVKAARSIYSWFTSSPEAKIEENNKPGDGYIARQSTKCAQLLEKIITESEKIPAYITQKERYWIDFGIRELKHDIAALNDKKRNITYSDVFSVKEDLRYFLQELKKHVVFYQSEQYALNSYQQKLKVAEKILLKLREKDDINLTWELRTFNQLKHQFECLRRDHREDILTSHTLECFDTRISKLLIDIGSSNKTGHNNTFCSANAPTQSTSVLNTRFFSHRTNTTSVRIVSPIAMPNLIVL